jgi:hypothetical protein
MEMVARVYIAEARSPEDASARRQPLLLGVAIRKVEGWRFVPFIVARKGSRKGYETWEKAIPRWVGHPNRTEARVAKPDETIQQVVDRWDA